MKTGKVHIWVPELIAREGGIQSYSVEMVEAAVEILGPGRVSVVSKTDDPRTLGKRFDGKVKTYATENVPALLRTPAFALLLVAVAVLEGPSLILSTHANFSPVAAWLQKWRKIPATISAHGIEVWDLAPGRIREALQQVRKILPVSEHTRRRMEKETGLPADKFTVISDTYDTEKFGMGPALVDLRKRLS